MRQHLALSVLVMFTSFACEPRSTPVIPSPERSPLGGAAASSAIGTPAPSPLTPLRLGGVPLHAGDPTFTRLLPVLPPSLATASHVTGYTDNPTELRVVWLGSDGTDWVSLRGDTPELALAVVGGRALAGWHDPDGFTLLPLGSGHRLDEFERPPGAVTDPDVWFGALSSGRACAGMLTYGPDGYGVSRVSAAVERIATLPAAAMVAAIADWEGRDGHCWGWATWLGYGLSLERRCDPLDHGSLGDEALGAKRWGATLVTASLGLASAPHASVVISADGDLLVHLSGPTDAFWPAAGWPLLSSTVAVPNLGPYRGLARTEKWLVTAAGSGDVMALDPLAGEWTPVRGPDGGALSCPRGASVQQGPAHVAWIICTDELESTVWQVGP